MKKVWGGAPGRVQVVFLAALFALIGACHETPHARSLLLITLDTTRADHMGAYGYAKAQTPTFDRLAKKGTLYERAYSAAPETMPSHTTMMTGLYPPSHGVRLNLDFKLPASVTTLAEVLAHHDFQTAAIVSSAVLNRRYGLDQGFGIYRDPPRGRGLVELPAESATKRALEAARDFTGKRFFLWVHYYDAHSPYVAQKPFKAPPDTAPDSPELYDLEIAYADLWVGKLLEGLEDRHLLDDTAVIVAGDHGESLGDHGETYHTLFIYDSTQHVPLLIRGPGVPAGERVSDPVPTVDVFATALKLLDIPIPRGTSSHTLPGLGFTESQDEGRPRIVYSESMAPPLRFGWSALEGVRTQRWFYVRAPREELYDLQADPDERVDIASSDPDDLAEMRRLLGRALRQMPTSTSSAEAGFNPTPDEQAQLASLGYLGASGNADKSQNAGTGEDPKDMVEVAEAFQLARLAMRLRRFDTAEDLLHFVVTSDPKNYGGWQLYGSLLVEMKRYQDAVKALDQALELRPSSWQVLLRLAIAERETGDVGAADWHLKEALRTTPFPAEAWRAMARLRVHLHDWKGAAAAYRKVLEISPQDGRATRALKQLTRQGFLNLEQAPGAEEADLSAALGPG